MGSFSELEKLKLRKAVELLNEADRLIEELKKSNRVGMYSSVLDGAKDNLKPLARMLDRRANEER